MKEQDYIKLFGKFLQKETTPEEIGFLIQWLKTQSSFDDWADKEWELATGNMDEQLQQSLFRKISEKLSIGEYEPSKGKRAHNYFLFVSRFMQGVAVLAFILMSILGVYQYRSQKQLLSDTIVSVDKGQKTNLILPDGSRVYLNAGSKLRYGVQFDNKQRLLHLDGEAYFEVIPDQKRPFIVQTNELSVRALGTSFNVKSYVDETQATTVLMTGKVEITAGDEQLLLLPNERVVFDKKNKVMTKSSIPDATIFSKWRQNTLTFQGETLENIAHTLERYYNVKIVFASESLKQYHFTGTSGNTSLNSMLQILALTSPLLYEMKDSTVILRENTLDVKKYQKMLTE